MDKTNVFCSTEFYMGEGDILHILIIDETGSPVTIELSNPDSIDGPPNATTALEATNIAETSFTANWMLSEGASGYFVDVATDSDFINFVPGYIDYFVSYNNSLSVTGLDADTTYYYRVRAYNEYGSGAESNTISTSTFDIAAPVATAATNITAESMDANWNASTGATGYYLDVAEDVAFTTMVTGYNNRDVGNVLTFPVTGLTSSTYYFYRIRMYNTYGTSANSNVISTPTSDIIAPTLLTVTATGELEMTLGWSDDSTNEDGFSIERGTNGVVFAEIDTVGAGVETYIDSTVTGQNTQYYYRVRAYKGAGYSQYTNTASDWTPMKIVFTKAGTGAARTILGGLYSASTAISMTIDGDAKFYSNTTGLSGESSSWIIPASPSNTTTYVQVNSGSSNVLIYHKNNLARIGYGLTGALYGGITLSSANAPVPSTTFANLARSLTHFGLSTATAGASCITGNVSDLPSGLINLTLLGGGALTGTCAQFPSSLTYLQVSTLTGGGISGSVADLPTNLTYLSLQGIITVSGNVSTLPHNLTNVLITGTNTISGNVSQFAQGHLASIYVSGNNTITGDVSGFDYVGSVLTIIQIYGSNTISGNISGIPSSVLHAAIWGSNTLSGDVSDFPDTLVIIDISGNNTISGNISGLHSGLTNVYITGVNTITGDISGIPSTISTLSISGNNTLSGNVSGLSAAMRVLTVRGSNTITGDVAGLPAAITNITISGNNTISGNITSLPTTLRAFDVAGANTITGDIANFNATLATIQITGSNTIYGDLANIKSTVTHFVIAGSSAISDYTSPKTWSNSFAYSFTSSPASGGLSSAEIDNLFIDLNASWSTTRTQTLMFQGTNAAPTATSAAARAALVTKGRTIYTN